MLEKLITNLKKSLPESIQKKLGMEEENEEATDEEGAEASGESEAEETEESEEGASSSDDEKKKKQKSMIVRVVVILALAYLAADHFLLKGDGENAGKTGEASVDDVLARAEAKRKAKNKKSKEELSAEIAKSGASAETTTAKPPEENPTTEPATTPPAAEVGEATTTAPVENVNILDKAEPAPPASEAVPETVTETTPAVQAETPVTTVAETPKTEEKVVGESKESPSMSEGVLDQKIDQLIDKVEGTASENSPKDENKKPSMTDKIVEELTYSAPPNYEQIGRGLVYNCVEKHWACVDKIAYVACNKNMKWNSAKEKASECVVHNVYSTDEDCAKVQKYNVTTNQPTTFCK